MPLILAIEPDRRQANQVNAVVRGRLHADLVLAESAERALAALGGRVPDLILTSAFLSPTDEVVLGEHLRTLDGAAAHVQTLTIPVLATSRSRSDTEIGGMLGALRRGKARASTPEGCDPAVFAAQCAEYLERAESERQTYSAHRAEERESAAAAPAPAPADAVDIDAHTAGFEAAAQQPAVAQRTTKADDVDPVIIDGPAAAAKVQEAIARLQAFTQLQDFVEQEAGADEPPPPVPVTTQAAASVVAPDANVDELELPEEIEEAPIATAASAAAVSADEPEVYDISEFDAEAFAVPVPAKATTHAAAPEPAAAAPSASTAAARPAKGRNTASEKRAAADQAKPVQDEWGFFDPEQAGFAALLAKLDEIDTDQTPKTTTKPRKRA